ncbi:MAG: HAD family hydrolase [Erythrobacter sp.]
MTDTILPHELSIALERAPEGVKVLSLDCFDTLLWRDCHAPTDVFAGLERVNTRQRAVGETFARKAEAVMHQRSEVGIGAIYGQALPNADESERAAAVDEELRLEVSACYAFAPTVQLMRAAKDCGLDVIIVSDTYLDAAQLLALITEAAGEEVAGLIDRVFASSEHGVSKSQGLLAKALRAMKCGPQEVLHIGDNREADYKSARALGIPALHLAQFSETVKRRLRFERTCQQLVGDKREGVRGLMPHRPLIALEEPQIEDAAEALGLSVLGPVFHGFDRWLRAEAEELAKATQGKVHWLFMLRDGHLPHIVHQEGGGATSTARVEISRFVAIAASLTSREAYSRQLALEADLNPATLARQMLLEESEIAMLIGDPPSDADRAAASRKLQAELRKGQRQKLTRRRARARTERLIAHIRSSCDPEPGDTLMLVDLGYNGSAQDRVDSILSEAFDVHVAGRYLLLREMAAMGLDKRGLIDARHYDSELLEALCGNVAVIEQLATCSLGSVIDFTDDGEPIRTSISVKGAQSQVRERVQAGALRFARASAEPPVVRCADRFAEKGWRDAVLSTLMRFMFLPEARELEVLKSFEHDVNLGSKRMVALFDPDHAREGMRRRGLFYMKGSARMFLPAEIEGEDIHTRLSLLVQNRFGLSLSYSDGAGDSIAIPAFYLDEESASRTTIYAEPTYEGFYAARLPLPRGTKGIGLQVGSVFEWFELAGVTVSPIATLRGSALNDEVPRLVRTRFEGVSTQAPGIHECAEAAATMLVVPPSHPESDEPHMVEVVMRPLRRRAGSVPASHTPQPLKDAAA